MAQPSINFYSRPCGRGDEFFPPARQCHPISTHAPAGGATGTMANNGAIAKFLLTPLREGRRRLVALRQNTATNFYSRPCGRGDLQLVVAAASNALISTHAPAGGATGRSTGSSRGSTTFLLTPLREGRLLPTSANTAAEVFLLTPLREGRLKAVIERRKEEKYFYSRPCGRGDCNFPQVRHEVLRQIAER